MRIVKWFSLEYRKEVHEKMQRHLCLLWNRAQIEEGGMEKQFNREAKEERRFAADAARIADESASSEDRKHTSGGVFVAIDSNLGAVMGAGEGAIESIPGNEGGIAQAWLNVRGGVEVAKRCTSGIRKVGPRSIHG